MMADKVHEVLQTVPNIEIRNQNSAQKTKKEPANSRRTGERFEMFILF
jgi:hypothetical protein